MDPFTDNESPCGILEVGDPLEGDANFGTYPYVRLGFTYHLQDMVLIPGNALDVPGHESGRVSERLLRPADFGGGLALSLGFRHFGRGRNP